MTKSKPKAAARGRAKGAPLRAAPKEPRKNRPAKPRPRATPRPRRRSTPFDQLRPIVIRGDKIAAATRLMAETLPLAGYTNILADCPGKRRPHLIRGMRADHRPNLVCQGGYRYVLMDVVFPGEMNFPDIASRWQLFSSAAEPAGGEFHVVVPRWVEGVGAGREAVSKAAEAIGIRISHIWEI